MRVERGGGADRFIGQSGGTRPAGGAGGGGALGASRSASGTRWEISPRFKLDSSDANVKRQRETEEGAQESIRY